MNDVGSSNLPNLNLYVCGGAGNTISINMSPYSSRSGRVAVRICAVDAANADADYLLQVATGKSAVVATEIMRASQQLTTFTPSVTNKNWLYLQGGPGFFIGMNYGGLSLEYQGGGYRNFIQSRHNSGYAGRNAINFFINNLGGSSTASSSPGVGNACSFIMDASVIVSNPVHRFEIGADFVGGDIYFPNNGAGIKFGKNFSRIFNNGNLHLYTDDAFHINLGSTANALHMEGVGNGKVAGSWRCAGSTMNFGVGNPDTQGLHVTWNKSGGNGEVIFHNQHGGGAGGFHWEEWNSSNVYERTSMSLDASGNLTTLGDYYLNSPTARFHMGLSTSRVIIGNIENDLAGDWHMWDLKTSRLIMGYFRASNVVKIGIEATTLRVGANIMASQSWVNAQGFLRTLFFSTIALTPTVNDGQTSITFSSKTDNSGSAFSIGRGIYGVTQNAIAIGHPTAGSNGWGVKMDAWGKVSFASDVSMSGMLTVDN